jgi:hypothetical protein
MDARMNLYYRQEHRRSHRFPLNLSMTVVGSGNHEMSQCAETRNVSSVGVYFVAPAAIAPGSMLQFVIALPGISSPESVEVFCRGRVVRAVPEPQGGGFGLAVSIERYAFVRKDHLLLEAFPSLGPSIC